MFYFFILCLYNISSEAAWTHTFINPACEVFLVTVNAVVLAIVKLSLFTCAVLVFAYVFCPQYTNDIHSLQ